MIVARAGGVVMYHGHSIHHIVNTLPSRANSGLYRATFWIVFLCPGLLEPAPSYVK